MYSLTIDLDYSGAIPASNLKKGQSYYRLIHLISYWEKWEDFNDFTGSLAGIAKSSWEGLCGLVEIHQLYWIFLQGLGKVTVIQVLYLSACSYNSDCAKLALVQ